MASRNVAGNYLVDMATRIAGEDIANDWVKTKTAAPPTALTYTLAELFAVTTISATSWKYSTVVNCAGYSKMFGRVQVNTTNGGVYWVQFGIGGPTNVASRYTVHSNAAVADNAIEWFDNIGTIPLVIGNWCSLSLYNADTGDATIVDAWLYLLP